MNLFSNKLARVLMLIVLPLAVHSAANAQNCRVRVLGDVAFGIYDPLQSGNLDATGLLRVRCAPAATNVSIKLDTGLSGSYQPRYMQSGPDQLAYNLYLDASRTIVWGDGTSGTDYRFFPVLGGWKMAPIYARTPLGQNVGSGNYSDTVVVTVEW